MGKSSGYAECSHCEKELPPDHSGPCPRCNKTGKKIVEQVTETVEVSDSLTWKTRREFFQKNPKVLVAGLALDLVSAVVGALLGGIVAGLLVAVIVAGLGYWLLPPAKEKVIKVSRGV